MSALILAVVVSIGLVTSLACAVEINDTANVLSILQQSHAGRDISLEDAMACGQSALFDANQTHCDIRCTKSYCMSQCSAPQTDTKLTSFQLFTDECSAGKANVFGDNGLIIELVKADFESQGGYWLLPFLKQIGQFIQPEPVSIDLNWAMPWNARLITDGKIHSFEIIQVRGSLIFGPGLQTEEIEIWLAPDLTGIEQIVRVALGGNSVFMKLHGLIESMN